MYDINFCFRNILSDVKIGVTTLIRVTHLSIGQTNDTWESNRKIFVEKYNDKLPIKVKLTENHKLNILISCLLFQNFTGSEMYVYELAKNLVKDNYDVTILAYETNGPLVNLVTKLGVKVLNIKDAPGYKLGDGKWAVLTENGYIPSVPNTFYKITDVHFDVIHCQHKPMVEMMVNLYPTIDKICTIHSEVISLEEPVKHDSIKKYIAIRPEIKNHLFNYFEIDEKDIVVIYNPIDETKFKLKNIKTNNNILFVGTIDYLRKQTIFDLIEYTKNNNKELWLVGKNQSNYLNEILNNSHVKYFQQRSNIEEMVYSCDETAGILLGRTTIEGWMCGKSGWIYDVDCEGNILTKKKYDIPNDLEKFYSKNVTKKIKELYITN
jgi:glycosyltransferase involved in cell wall biosynthesis